MKKKEEVYDNEKGPLAIICLQSMAGILEPLEKAKRAWRGFADWEKESTTRTHKLLFKDSFKPKKIVAPPPPPEKKGCILVQFKPGMSDSRKIVFLVEAALEAETIRYNAYERHYWSNEVKEKEEQQKLQQEWKPIWKHPDGPGYYCKEKGLKLEDVDVSSDLAAGKIQNHVIRIERRRRMHGPTDTCWGWHTGELALGCKIDGDQYSPGEERSWGWRYKIDLIRALHAKLGIEFKEKERKPTVWKPKEIHVELADDIVLFVRNDGEIYRSQVSPLVKRMEEMLKDEKYDKESVLRQFEGICSSAICKFQQENRQQINYYQLQEYTRYRIGVARVCAAELEEYWRTESQLQLKNGFSAVG